MMEGGPLRAVLGVRAMVDLLFDLCWSWHSLWMYHWPPQTGAAVQHNRCVSHVFFVAPSLHLGPVPFERFLPFQVCHYHVSQPCSPSTVLSS